MLMSVLSYSLCTCISSLHLKTSVDLQAEGLFLYFGRVACLMFLRHVEYVHAIIGCSILVSLPHEHHFNLAELGTH